MTACLDEDAIAAYVQHDLAADEIVRVEAHLARCVPCRRLVSVLMRASSISRDRAESPALEDTVERPSSSALPFTAGFAVGRYRIERELGTGGMGRVYAAFDPVLERRVALKVLHASDGSERLLHEARAMARLVHPNIVAVHEVGRADGRDYVAMELVDGETLDEWLRGGPRTPREILEAFAAAGRGLAAAHAAGIVHRDFKPHNVLRSRDGRVLVTDFGLARVFEDAITDPDVAAGARTLTGHVRGTPAYMAPEQWRNKAIGPAADQFAFCVALWEALEGARPYLGDTGRDILHSIDRGPDALAASTMSGQLARALRRGLRADPAQRWPDLASLLGQLVPRRSRRLAAFTSAFGVIALAAVPVYVVCSPRVDASSLCPAPQIAGETAWSPALAARVPPELAQVLDATFVKWSAEREQACTAPLAVRTRRVACLDGVLARFDAIRRAATSSAAHLEPEDLATQLVDPDVCERAEPPRLALSLSPSAVAAFGIPFREGVHSRAPDAPASDACGRALGTLATARTALSADDRDTAEEAVSLAETCGDDRILFDAMIIRARADNNALMVSPAIFEYQRRVAGLLPRVAQPDTIARAKLLDAEIEGVQEDWDHAFADLDTAQASWGMKFPRAQLHAAVVQASMLWVHNREREARGIAARWLPVAARLGATRDAQNLTLADAQAQWLLGDVAGAHQRLDQLAADLLRDRPEVFHQYGPTERVEGIVVDGAGHPMPGARIAYEFPALAADSTGPGLMWWQARTPELAYSDARGNFVLPDAPSGATVVAEHGRLRSLPVTTGGKLRLVVQPTITVRGHVDLHDVRDMTIVFAQSMAPGAAPTSAVIAPIAADGTYELHGVARGKLQIGTLVNHMLGRSSQTSFPITLDRDTPGVDLTVAPNREVAVVVRASSDAMLTRASVVAVRGATGARKWHQLRARDTIAVSDASPMPVKPTGELAAVVQTGDVVATLDLPQIEASVCATAARGGDTAGFVARAVLDDDDVRCVPVPRDTNIVLVEIAPMRRR